jgi:UDP:flavonoid glycosyltransferase YjiC (YdhE family)
MANILFIMLPEAGHLNASFKIARALQARGHSVFYSEPPYLGQRVTAQGFDFAPLLEDYFPPSFDAEQAASVSWFEVLKSVLKLETAADTMRAFGILREELRALTVKTRPDLLLIDGLLPELAMTAHEMRLPCMLINTALYDPFDDHGMVENAPVFASVLLKMPALFLCPQEFDFPRQRAQPQHYYVEASIDLERTEASFDWEKLDQQRSLIYCSLGSQSFLYEESVQVLQTLMDAVALRDDCQMVLSTGNHLRAEDFGAVPANVILVQTAPQLSLLKRASLMITHGGLNTIKESILMGVPMIVFAMKRDQPRNAARIAYHGLGVMGNAQYLTVGLASSLIEQVMKNASFKEKVEAMGRIFKEREEAAPGVRVIESMLGKIQVH